MSAPTQPRIQTPEVRSTPLYPRSLERARIALNNAAQLAETAATHAQRYDDTRLRLGHDAVEQARLLAGPDDDRLETMRALRKAQSDATVASAASGLNLGYAHELQVAFLIAAGGIRVNHPVDRSAMIAVEPRE